MSKLNRIATGGVALGSSLVLIGTAAMAATGVVIDPRGDALAVTDSWLDSGDFDIDLTRIDIDHGTKRLDVTARFNKTVPDSWTFVNALLDTNGDGLTDYTATWFRDYGTEGAWVVDASDNFTCANIATSERLGTNGTVTLRIPRSCIGTPRQVAVHVEAVWAGQNTQGKDLYFVDTAPGEFIDELTAFSAPVRSSNTGTATSPAPPRVVKANSRTRTTATFNAKKRVATVRVRVTSPNKQAGQVKGRVRIRVMRAGKPVRTVTRKLNGQARVVVKVPKKFLKRKGQYRVVGRYLGGSKHKVSQNAAVFRVR